VPEEALSGLHMALNAGGTREPLPRATVAGYMSCDRIPEGEDFGHSCLHGEGPHDIKVLVFKSHNAAGAYERLRTSAEERGSR